MATNHKLIIGNCVSMKEILKNSVYLVVTSPPYFNALFDYKGLFKIETINKSQKLVLYVLKKESFVNNFKIKLNNHFL